MISVAEAQLLLQNKGERGTPTYVPLANTLGKILAENVISPMDVPSFNNSAMDGYAMIFDGKKQEWEVKGTIQAGDTTIYSIGENEAFRIYTGAKVPSNADTVIPQELIIAKDDPNKIQYLHSSIKKGANIRLQGTQCRKGEQVLSKGVIINPGIIGFLATLGIAEVMVYPSPSVGCIITGNELKELGQSLEPGEIYNSNGPMLQASLQAIGIVDIQVYRVEDEPDAVLKTIESSLKKHDFLLISGGISVGDYDFVKDSLHQLGVSQIFYKIKQRPGKPLFAGKWNGKQVFALPGNPASVASCFNHYVKPCIKYYMGHDASWQPDRLLPLEMDTKKKAGFTFFIKAYHNGKSVLPLTGQESFNMKPFAKANCFVELPEDSSEVAKGTLVKVFDCF